MRDFYTNGKAKALAAVLAVVLGVGLFWAGFFTLFHWDELWMNGGYYESTSIYDDLYDYRWKVYHLIHIDQAEDWQQGGLSYLDKQRREQYKQELDPTSTNFRVQVHADTGEKLYDNLGKDGTLEKQVHSVDIYTEYLSLAQCEIEDNQRWDEARRMYYLEVSTVEGTELLSPLDGEKAMRYGWQYDGSSWNYDQTLDQRYKLINLVFEYGITDPLTVHDAFWQAQDDYFRYRDLLPVIAFAALLLGIFELMLLVFLTAAAGRRRGMPGYVRNWQDRIPLEIYGSLLFCIFLALFGGADQIAYSFNQLGATTENVVGIGVFSILFGCILMAAYLTLVARLKTRTLLRNTLCWKCCACLAHTFRRWISSISHNWSMVWRFGLLFFLYLVGTLISTMTLILIPFYQGAVFYLILRWVKQWRSIRTGAAHIVGGDPDYRIDTTRMYTDLKLHAEQLNDLGSAISNAVEDRMKSERFKTELITNVSHDLKTPLTSIINYVDLLKKVELGDAKALEYIEVLDRKSQRLKKLTEDLVEASKASTGSLTVVRDRLGLVQLVQQAMGEYEEKFSQNQLQLIPTLPEKELYVEADGRHLWRIIDNLFSNCYKYAMENTRIYLDLTVWDGAVVLSVKNISRQALNIPVDQLMERFVRGEEARSTEGSGLGLSIARSLTELQGGAFRLTVDGDLFKAVVSFPEAPIRIPPQKSHLPEWAAPASDDIA